MNPNIDDKTLTAAILLLERYVRDIYSEKRSSAIQPLQWSILRYLVRMPKDRCEVRWLADFLGMTRAPISRAIATLESRGYVQSQLKASDARTKLILLTDLGLAVLGDDPIVKTVKGLRSLPEVELQQLVKVSRCLALGSGKNDDQ